MFSLFRRREIEPDESFDGIYTVPKHSLLKRLSRRLDAMEAHTFAIPQKPHTPWQSQRLDDLTPMRRMLVHVTPRQPFVQWVRKKGTPQELAESLGKESIAYLIPGFDWETVQAEQFVAHFWHHFFAQALEGCDMDQAGWPKKRTIEMFHEWFEVRYSEMVLDLGGIKTKKGLGKINFNSPAETNS